MTPLSPEVQAQVELVFSPELQAEAAAILAEQCGTNIPRWEMAGIDRLRLAALKLSQGRIEKLQKAVDMAKRDLRNVLMAAERREVGPRPPSTHR